MSIVGFNLGQIYRNNSLLQPPAIFSKKNFNPEQNLPGPSQAFPASSEGVLSIAVSIQGKLFGTLYQRWHTPEAAQKLR